MGRAQTEKTSFIQRREEKTREKRTVIDLISLGQTHNAQIYPIFGIANIDPFFYLKDQKMRSYWRWKGGTGDPLFGTCAHGFLLCNNFPIQIV